MSNSFVIYDLQGNVITLDRDKRYVRTQYGQIVEIPEGQPVDASSLALVASQADLRISDVNFSNILKVDTKLTMAKDQLISRKRKSFTYTTATLQGDEFEKFDLPIGCSAFVIRLEVDVACTVEIYPDSSYADATPYTFIATDDHLLDDGRILMSDNTSTITKRTFLLVNRDSPIQNKLYAKITNSESSTPQIVNLIMEYISIETVDVTQALRIVTTHNSNLNSSGQMYKVSALLATPARFVLGPNAQDYIPTIETVYQSSYDVLSEKLPTRFWPIDEDGGYWVQAQENIEDETTSQYLNKFVWDQTPQDGDYALYFRLDELPPSIVFPTTTVYVSIKLGSQLIDLEIPVDNTLNDLSKVWTACIKFSLNGGEFKVNPKIVATDIDRVSAGVA